MSVNTDSMIRNILDRVSRIGYVKPEDIPNIDLYMDQVTTFMEAQLAHSKRYEDDKILTNLWMIWISLLSTTKYSVWKKDRSNLFRRSFWNAMKLLRELLRMHRKKTGIS